MIGELEAVKVISKGSGKWSMMIGVVLPIWTTVKENNWRRSDRSVKVRTVCITIGALVVKFAEVLSVNDIIYVDSAVGNYWSFHTLKMFIFIH